MTLDSARSVVVAVACHALVLFGFPIDPPAGPVMPEKQLPDVVEVMLAEAPPEVEAPPVVALPPPQPPAPPPPEPMPESAPPPEPELIQAPPPPELAKPEPEEPELADPEPVVEKPEPEKLVSPALAPPPPKPPIPATVSRPSPPGPKLVAVAARPSPTPAPNSPPASRPGTSGSAPRPALLDEAAWVKRVVPQYPHEAIRRKDQGVVIIRFLINPLGKPEQIEISESSGHRSLDEAAVKAVKWSRFRPPYLNGRPLTGKVEVPFRFVLPDHP